MTTPGGSYGVPYETPPKRRRDWLWFLAESSDEKVNEDRKAGFWIVSGLAVLLVGVAYVAFRQHEASDQVADSWKSGVGRPLAAHAVSGENIAPVTVPNSVSKLFLNGPWRPCLQCNTVNITSTPSVFRVRPLAHGACQQVPVINGSRNSVSSAMVAAFRDAPSYTVQFFSPGALLKLCNGSKDDVPSGLILVWYERRSGGFGGVH